MGQYCVIVNLTKQEYISPEPFNDGPKLVEMAESRAGILRGLTVLLASCNDGNGGDYYRMVVCEPDQPLEIESYEKAAGWWKDPRDGKITHTVVPECSGRWAGDKIIITGDAMPVGGDMTEALKLRGAAAWVVLERNKHEYIPRMNLYNYAQMFFKDISDGVAKSLKVYNRDPNGPFVATMNRFFKDKLCSDFGSIYIHDKSKKGKNRWDLRWMDYELVDSFMLIFNVDNETMKAAKAWFRKQELAPWQRELIRLYKVRNVGMGRPSERDRSAIMQKYGLPLDYKKKLLPSRSFIEAAAAAERKIMAETEQHELTSHATETLVATELGMTGREERMIDIEPQGKEPDAEVSQTTAGPRRAGNARKRGQSRAVDTSTE